MSIAEVSENLASRDLKTLVDQGLLVTAGEKRGRYYLASDALKVIRLKTREPKKDVDPFVVALADISRLEGREVASGSEDGTAPISRTGDNPRR